MIKGLVENTELNDQMIVSIFSHVSRTINHREIGYFRNKENKKYGHIKPASRAEVERFMAHYPALNVLSKSTASCLRRRTSNSSRRPQKR